MWRAILEGAEAARAIERAKRIGDELAAGARSEDESLFSGLAGLALLFAYLDEAFPGIGHGERAGDLVVEALERAADPPVPGFAWGIAGLAWVTEHLRARGLDVELDDSIDEYLVSVLDRSDWPFPYDLMDGLVGMGLSALSRRDRAPAHRVLELVLGHLEAICDDGGPAGMRFVVENRGIDRTAMLGVSHGTASVLGLMSRYVAAGLAPARALRLLRGSVTRLLSQRQPPSIAPGPGSWCHGDLGVAIVLHHAAAVAGEPSWAAAAAEAMGFLAGDPAARSRCEDAGFCHGAIGAAHAFHRFHAATGDVQCRDAARAMYLRAIDGEVEEGPHTLLTGRAGVALGLLSGPLHIAPDWDECFLLRL